MCLGSRCGEDLLSLSLPTPYLYLALFSLIETGFPGVIENIASGTLESHPSSLPPSLSWEAFTTLLRTIIGKASDWPAFCHVPIPEPITVALEMNTSLKQCPDPKE